MHPLQVILKWWESLDEFPRFCFASETIIRLTQTPYEVIGDNHEELFREYLAEKLDAPRHLGRTVAVRAAIDFEFSKTSIDNLVEQHLETVETVEHKKIKSLANEAIRRQLENKPGWEKAHREWRSLKSKELSDSFLIEWERKCIVRAMQKKFPS